MIYKDFKGLRLSALGLGCMRLPLVDGNDAKVDEAAAGEMVACAMQNGVNYYDTAWGYHGGTSEAVMGKLLSAYPRKSFYLATKFPGYDPSNMDKAEEIFTRQLENCRVEYFDFYLLHNVCEKNIEGYLDERNGLMAYLLEQKKNGRIRHLGFSTHGSLETMQRFLERYGRVMEFCQIQLNWLDWSFQKAAEKVALLREYGLPVWVMEPLRGGKLAKLAEADAAALAALRPDEDTPAWAFRFLQGVESVGMILSGMSDMAQLQANLRTFETEKPLNPAERETLLRVAERMVSAIALPCTGCRYCTAYCPQGLNIPWLLELYNEHIFTGGGFIAPMALQALPKEQWPSACQGCRSCEKVCPQQIKISEAMSSLAERIKG